MSDLHSASDLQLYFDTVIERYISASSEEDFERVLVDFKCLANKGHVGAMSRVGYMLANGEGACIDYDEALIWLERAAGQGDMDAVNNLGVMYLNGWGMNDRDIVKAYECFELAAENGNPKAQLSLAGAYLSGVNREQDIAAAAQWYRKAAAQGEPWAEYHLGELYWFGGPDFEADRTQAVSWYLAGAESAHAECLHRLGEIARADPTGSVAGKTAEEWFQLAAAQGHQESEDALLQTEDDGIVIDVFPDLRRMLSERELSPIVQDFTGPFARPGAKEVYIQVTEDQVAGTLSAVFGSPWGTNESHEFALGEAPSIRDRIEHGFRLIAQHRLGLETYPDTVDCYDGDRVTLEHRVQERLHYSLRADYRLTYEVGAPSLNGQPYGLAGALSDWYYGSSSDIRAALIDAKIRTIRRFGLAPELEADYCESVRNDVNFPLPDELR